MRSRILAWTGVLFFIFCFNIFANDRGSPKTSREIAELGARAVPVVKVSYDFNGERVEIHGSGFFINYNGQVITNAHVVRKEPDTWRDGPRPSWFDGHQILGTNYKYQVELPWINKVFEARLVSLRKYKDWAKLQVIGLSNKDYDVLRVKRTFVLMKSLFSWSTRSTSQVLLFVFWRCLYAFSIIPIIENLFLLQLHSLC